MNSSGLYERAVDGAESAILHIGGGCTFWAGPNEYLASHQGAAPVYLAGLYGKFRLRIGDGAWRLCSGAAIPPGVWHELDFGGEPFAALYLEPNFATGRALAPLLSGGEMIDGVLVGRAGGVSLLRSLYEDRNGAEWAGLAINDLLRFSRRRAEPAQVDPRLSGVVEFLHQYCDDLTPVAELARCVGLSASRFQHLFSRQAGVPLRRYRAWSRLRAAWREIAKGEKLTMAALNSGFSDSAHFAHEFRRTFGSAASRRSKKPTRLSETIAGAERSNLVVAGLAKLRATNARDSEK